MTIEFDGQNNKLGTTTANSVTIKTNDTDALTVDSSQNVGIGTISPSSFAGYTTLGINNATNGGLLELQNSGTTYGQIFTDGTNFNIRSSASATALIFDTNGANERMRLTTAEAVINDQSNDYDFRVESNNNTHALFVDGGNDAVLFGKSAYNSFGTAGVEIRASVGLGIFTRDSSQSLILNRTTNDGDLVDFRKDGTVVGSIKSQSGNSINVISGEVGVRFSPPNDAIYPVGSSGNRDNAIDLGVSNVRFDDIYATNGTIQTSDQNEKQSIQSLTASEIAVAKRISKLFKTFKFNSSVEEKGDSARTHTGVIAQEVQQAFADEGLDASNYALFISGTWWEKEISVDAVAEELDEEGNVVVEGKDAYTYMDIKEEATEGYTQRTRLGIRYPELLSFVSSAFEQRLTNIETRLEALENE